MILIGGKISISECTGCQSCYNICPTEAIIMKEEADTFLYPFIDQEKCIDCYACEKACPAISEVCHERNEPACYASWHQSDSIRIESSSGGFFTALAEYFFEKKGFVYGAAFTDNLYLRHVECASLSELEEIRGSKYIQSDINKSYISIKQHLKRGEYVLFSGSPCQVSGLYTYLKKDYPTLLTCDFVCHGVPSAKLFSDYKKELEEKYRSKITTYAFRKKKDGWKDFNVEAVFESGFVLETTFPRDMYMKGFLADLYLRPSCYQCLSSRLPRVADISIADYWKVWKYMPEIYDTKGVSAILLNSGKGKDVFKYLQGLESVETNLDWIVKGNPSLNSSVNKPRKRKKFYRLYKKGMMFEDIIQSCLPPPTYWDKVCWSINKRLNKIRKKDED